jgi:hypothetical protein
MSNEKNTPHKNPSAKGNHQLSTVSVRMGRNGKGNIKTRQPKIISQVIKLSRDYSKKSTDKWRNAVIMAENPQYPMRTYLYDVYADLSYDLHYQHLRRMLCTDAAGTRFNIIDAKTKKVDEKFRTLFDAEWFTGFIEHITDTFFWGHTLLEIQKADPEKGEVCFELIPRKHVSPEYGGWTTYSTDTNYTIYCDTPAMDWLIELGGKYDLGWLNLIAKEILFKKVSMVCWSEFGERFGMPLAKAKTNTRDVAAINRMEGFLKKMAGSSYAIIDNAEDIEFVASGTTDSYNVYNQLVERCNSEMSKAILLQIMASDVGSNGSRAQSEVHERTGDKAARAWLKHVENTVNNKLIPLLIKHGFELEGKQFKYIEEKFVDATSFAQDQWLKENFEIDAKYFAEKYGVPLKERKEMETKVEDEETAKANELLTQ